MSILKKGSRRIVVDDVEYRWRVRSRPTYDQGLTSSPLTLAVEKADGLGSVLVVDLPQCHPSNWMSKPSWGVTPKQVAENVQMALKAGWQPTIRGVRFRMKNEGIPKPQH